MRLITVSLALGLLILTACSSTQRPLFINTDLSAPEALDLHQTRFRWQLQDQRSQAYALSITKRDERRTFKNKLNLPESLQQQLEQIFTLHGARIDPQAPSALKFKVLELHAKAQQHPLDHEVHSSVEIELNINSSTGVYRKRFQGKSSYTAPFKVDHAVVERELRQLTEHVITDILNDHHWQDYLRSHQ
ncbi:MAG: YajG family lipoprotein [Alkalimonas sp.]|nr:YajG family lipoprotein [Alkalimonas sp.]